MPSSRIKSVLVAAALAIPSPALAQLAAPADSKAITDCVKKAESEGALGGNCIGMIADPCVQQSDKTRIRLCAARELAVWVALADAATRKVRAGGSKDVKAALVQSNRGWAQLRKSLCPAFDKTEPGTLRGDAAYCRMQTTAHRALLLRKLGETVMEN